MVSRFTTGFCFDFRTFLDVLYSSLTRFYPSSSSDGCWLNFSQVYLRVAGRLSDYLEPLTLAALESKSARHRCQEGLSRATKDAMIDFQVHPRNIL